MESIEDAPELDWTKGEVLAPVNFLALMVGTTGSTAPVEGEKDI